MPVCVQLSIAPKPGGSVSLKTPHLRNEDQQCDPNISSQYSRWFMSWRADYSDTFGELNLVSAMRVQISRAHEARLRWVCVNPTQRHQILAITVIKEGAFIHRVASITRGFLLWNDKLRYKKGI
jgi:hypothetical protein